MTIQTTQIHVIKDSLSGDELQIRTGDIGRFVHITRSSMDPNASPLTSKTFPISYEELGPVIDALRNVQREMNNVTSSQPVTRTSTGNVQHRNTERVLDK